MKMTSIPPNIDFNCRLGLIIKKNNMQEEEEFLESADEESVELGHVLFTASGAPQKSLQNIHEALKLIIIFIAKCLPGGYSNRKIDEFDKYLV